MRLGDVLQSKLDAIPAGVLEERQARRRAAESAKDDDPREDRWKLLVAKIGVRYADCTIAGFERYNPHQAEVLRKVEDYGRNLAVRVHAGDSIVLFGPSGTGKDHMLAALMKLAVKTHGMHVEWRNGMDLYGDFRDSMDSKEIRESHLVQKLVCPQILVVSDPLPPWIESSNRTDVGVLTPFQASTLFRIIDGRYRHKRPTWITLNVKNDQEAARRMGQSAFDRLCENTLALFCDWPSYRSGR